MLLGNCFLQSLVVVFSIGHDFRFEKGIEEMLKCEVHAFDPRYNCFIVFIISSVLMFNVL